MTEQQYRAIIHELKEQLRCVADNLEKSMSKSIQGFQARTIRETIRDIERKLNEKDTTQDYPHNLPRENP